MAIPAPDPRVSELLGGIRSLELVARRNAAGLMTGDYVTSIPGRGLVFHETRKYVPGEGTHRISALLEPRIVSRPTISMSAAATRRRTAFALLTCFTRWPSGRTRRKQRVRS